MININRNIFLIIILVILLPSISYLQQLHNSNTLEINNDTTWVFNYYQLLSVRENIEELKYRKFLLEKEIIILNDLNTNKDLVIKKLQLRDSLNIIELKHFAKTDSILNQIVNRYDRITYNYKVRLLSTEDKLDAEIKKKRRERLWKNIYKYAYPVTIGIATIVLLK